MSHHSDYFCGHGGYRHFGGGGHGRHRHFAGGGRGFFGGAFGGGFRGGGPGMRTAKMLASGDLQLIILLLLSESPRHGYEIIKAVEEHSSGVYTPSPGMVYPALTYLEEMGYAAAAAEGTRKLYSITAEGTEHLSKNRGEANELWDRLAIFGRNCHGQPWKNPFLIDITDDRTPWPIAVLDVGQFPGNFCARGSRFGVHEINRQIYPPYYGRLLIVAMFNAGWQVWDVRDPYSPRRVAYFIQAPNKNTHTSCGTYQNNAKYCRKEVFSDLGEIDDRGYIYNLDRAGSGLTILQLTGDALKVVTGPGQTAH